MKVSKSIKNPYICIVTPVHNRIKSTLKFLESIKRSSYTNYNIVIIDDGSTDNTFAIIKKNYPTVITIRGDGNLFWTGGTNLGVKYALKHGYDYVLTINNDAIVEKDSLTNLVKSALDNPNSIIGSTIILPKDNKIWAIGTSLNWDTYKEQIFKLNYNGKDAEKTLAKLPNLIEVETMPGNGTLIPTEVFNEVGLYNNCWFPHYHADSELILRARNAGYNALISTKAKIYNHDFKKKMFDNDIDLLIKRNSYLYWKPILAIFLKHAPKEHKNKFVRQYYFLYEDKWWYEIYNRVAWKIKNLISTLIQAIRKVL